MAYYAALVSLIELLKDVSHSDMYPDSLLDKQQVFSLYEKFSHLQELLEDYSPKPKEEKSTDFLENRIRDAANRVQDVIESHISDHIPRSKDSEDITDGFKRVFQFKFSAWYKTKSRPVHEELEQVKEEVDSIVEELLRIKVEERQRNDKECLKLNSYISADIIGGASKVQTPSEGNTMVGFDEYLKTIKAQLCGESSKLEVISIVGMGGLGKTTLARNIFDDKLVNHHFDYRVWVTVSQDYHLDNVFQAIVDSLNIKVERYALKWGGLLKDYIFKHLYGRRYLIVMDDVWDTKVWDFVKSTFPDCSNGSRVVITTRLLDLAVYTNSSRFVHQIQLLNKKQSWGLFCEKVFCPRELEDIGRFIVKNCRGLPLAIVVVAGLLSKTNTTQCDWEEIARGLRSTRGRRDHFSKIMSLSYNNLPHHLKPCFLYLGGFPEDCEIRVSKLVRLWVAEGFLKPIESKNLEEVAEEYLAELVKRNLVMINKWGSNGRFKCCSIHDLLRDLCSEKARKEKFYFIDKHEDSQGYAIGNVPRLYIYRKSLRPREFKGRKLLSRARSFLFFQSIGDHFISDASSFKLLRVLDAPNVVFQSFRAEILGLVHLRYLALLLQGFDIPSYIFKLQNLQTLIIHSSSDSDLVISLPPEIWKMPRLRHVIFDKVKLPPISYGGRIIDGVPLLGMLQTLGTVINFTFSRDTVEMIPNLKKLKLRFGGSEPWEEFGLKNLVHLHQLETLFINFDLSSQSQIHQLPESFAFPLNLKKLTLVGGRIPWTYMKVVGSLPNLEVLKLRWNAFVGDEWEPVEEGFCKLKFLLMESLNLMYWRAENTHFPRLEQLHIHACYKLSEIPSEIGDIPTLQLIEVSYSNPGVRSSALKIQEEQWDLGNDSLQVRIH